MNFLIRYKYQLFSGAMMTLGSWMIAGIASIFIGLVLGIISSRYFGFPILERIVRVYTFIVKGIPAYVQILIAYFVVPSLLGINLPGLCAAILALTFCSSGYATEIWRIGLNAIPVGQWEASFVLGYSFKTALRRIILPQVVKNMLPALFGELEQLLKSTALLATIGITEITRTGMNIVSRELDPLPVYFTVACIYLMMSAFLQFFMIQCTRKMSYGRN